MRYHSCILYSSILQPVETRDEVGRNKVSTSDTLTSDEVTNK